jgi:hypothetical protein
MLLFEWDEEKDKTNEKKHGISFHEATSAFSDSYSLTIHDPLHSENEDRFIIIGYSMKNRLVVVVYSERGNKIRIISARKATRKERLQYENHVK